MKLLRITVLSLIVALPACAGAIAIQQPTDDTPDNGGSYYCPSISQTLKRGMRDTQTSPAGQVSELQNFLADYFNLDEQMAVSGYFGRSTQQYLTRFQAANGLPAYGIAGTLTRAKIADVCKSGGTPSCPVFQQLRCKDGEEYVPGSKDSRGCMTQGYCKPNICPMIAVDCMPGYHTEAVDAVDANGCRKPPVCKPDVCIAYPKPLCKDGYELVEGVRDARGCATQAYCKPKICPMVAVDCMPGYHTEAVDGVDANGCRKPPVCKPNICPVYDASLCPIGTSPVSGGKDSNGCDLPPRCTGGDTSIKMTSSLAGNTYLPGDKIQVSWTTGVAFSALNSGQYRVRADLVPVDASYNTPPKPGTDMYGGDTDASVGTKTLEAPNGGWWNDSNRSKDVNSRYKVRLILGVKDPSVCGTGGSGYLLNMVPTLLGASRAEALRMACSGYRTLSYTESDTFTVKQPRMYVNTMSRDGGSQKVYAQVAIVLPNVCTDYQVTWGTGQIGGGATDTVEAHQTPDRSCTAASPSVTVTADHTFPYHTISGVTSDVAAYVQLQTKNASGSWVFADGASVTIPPAVAAPTARTFGATQVASPYESFMWIVDGLKRLGQ